MTTIPKPSAIRNYLYEYILIALVVATVTIFYMFLDQTKFIRDHLIKQIEQNNEVMKTNADALNQYMNWKRFNDPKKNNDEQTK